MTERLRRLKLALAAVEGKEKINPDLQAALKEAIRLEIANPSDLMYDAEGRES